MDNPETLATFGYTRHRTKTKNNNNNNTTLKTKKMSNTGPLVGVVGYMVDQYKNTRLSLIENFF